MANDREKNININNPEKILDPCEEHIFVETSAIYGRARACSPHHPRLPGAADGASGGAFSAGFRGIT